MIRRGLLCNIRTFCDLNSVVIVVGGLVIFALTTVILPAHAQSVNVTDTPNLTNQTSGNWTTYSNNIFGISFDYPSDWEVNEKQGRFEKVPDVTVTDGQTSFKVVSFDKAVNDILQRHGLTETVKQFEKSTGDEEGNRIIESTDMKKYKIDGERTGTFLYTIDNGDGSTVAQQSFLLQHGGKGYLLSFGDSTLTFDIPETQNIMKRIIQSFRFIT